MLHSFAILTLGCKVNSYEGQQIRQLLETSGLTQVELAKRLGVSQAQVARIEKQGYDAYTLTTLRRYVEALGEGFELQVVVRRAVPGQMTQAAAGV